LLALSGIIGIIAALIRQHWGWAAAIAVGVLVPGGYYAALLLAAAASNASHGGDSGSTSSSLLNSVDPSLLTGLAIALPLALCIVLLAYTFSADRALDAQRRDRSQRNTLLTLAILGAVFVAFFWLGNLLELNISSDNLGNLLRSPNALWILTFVAIGTAATAFYAWARSQRAWSLSFGVLALAGAAAIVVLTPQGKIPVIYTYASADPQATLLAIVIFFAMLTLPLASLIYLIIGRRFASAMDLTPAPSVTPA
jgi:hypothetical protein